MISRVVAVLWVLPVEVSFAAGKVAPSVDISIDHAQQDFGATEGSVTTFTVSPAVQWGDGWEARIDLPWQRAEGEFVIPQAAPAVSKFCRWASKHPRQLQRLIAQGKITQAQLDECDTQAGGIGSSGAQGVGDVIVWLNRFIPYGERWAALPQIGYKTDSGDESEGLGTGTRDFMIELGLAGDYQPLAIFFMLGYDRVLSQSEVGDFDDYVYASSTIEWTLEKQWSVGASYQYEAAQADYLDDLQSVIAQLIWRFADDYSARVYLQDYADSDAYPERETGLSLSASF